MATMQEYLEEMARRQATGWTPGVPNRFAVPVSTTWNLPSTARTTMRQAVPKANLGDISAQSNPQSTTKRRGRPRTTADKLQSISDRAGTGTIKPMLGAISKIAGPAGIAAELLRSEPAVASELAPGINPTDFRVTQAYPSMAVEEGYPNVSTLPSFDVTPDAGGAIGGVPGEQPMEKYGPSGYEGERIPPTGFRQIAPDSVIAASDFEVGPTSVAQVGTNSFGIPDKSYGKVSKTHSELLADTAATKEMNTSVDKMINKLGNTVSYFPGAATTPKDELDKTKSSTALSGTAQDYGYTNLFKDVWDHPYMESEDAVFSQGMKQMQDYQDMGPFAAAVYGLGQPFQEGLRNIAEMSSIPPAFTSGYPTGALGTIAQMAPMFGVQQDNIPALVDDIVERNVLNPFGFENPLATSALADPNITAMNTLSEDFDELAFGAFGTKHVPGTSVPVTPPDTMLMQDFIDKYGPVQSGTRDAYYHRDGTVRNAAGDVVSTPDATYNEYAGMGQVASHPGQGGYIGDTERTIGEHLAAVNERVQAMPAVTTSQALSTQDERQQAMPEVSVPAPTAPTVAAVAAQDRLAQMQADAAMRRAAQQAAAQDAVRLAAQRAAVQADIAAAQAEQDRVRQANALMNSKSYQESGLDGLSAAERDIVAAAQVDTFAGINRQVRGDSDTAGERSAGMGGGRGGFAGPDRW